MIKLLPQKTAKIKQVELKMNRSNSFCAKDLDTLSGGKTDDDVQSNYSMLQYLQTQPKEV